MNAKIKNKKDLIMAAQKFAAENLTIADSHVLGKKRHETFDSFDIAGEHYDEFRQMTESARNTYQAGEECPVKQNKPA